MPASPRTAGPTAPRDTRMTLLADEFISEFKPYRFRAGTVVLVDAETAQRWRENEVAIDAAETDRTIAEAKRAEIERLKKQVEDLESGEAVGDVGADPAIVQTRTRRAVQR